MDERIEKLKEVIRNTPPEALQERVYTCIANGCILLTAYKRAKGKAGWSSFLHDEFGKPMLNSKEQVRIEEAFSAPWILEMLESDKPQSGGNYGRLPNLKIPGSAFLKTDVSDLVPKDMSLDLAFEGLLKKSDEMDTFWNKIAYDSPGYSKLMNNDLIIPPTPYTPFQIPIPVKPLVQLFITILDSIRLSAGLSGNSSTLLTLIVLIEEIVTGQWRQMIMTASGFISPSGMAIGVIAKYIINAWVLINPDIRTELVKDIFKGTKSMLIGFLLWCVSTLPPAMYRSLIEEKLKVIREKVINIDEKLSAVSKPLKNEGKSFTTSFEKITLQDIQNLQALATWDKIICTEEFQDIMKPLVNDPIFRLILELMNVPTTDDDKYKMCRMEEPYGSVTGESSIGVSLEDLESPKDETTPESPKDETTPESTKTPETPKAPESPKAPETPKVTETPKAPESPKAEAPKAKKGGAVKLKKSTRFRKATPRRTTLRHPRLQH